MNPKKYIVEFIGAFFLVFTIGMAVLAPGAGAMAALAIGASLMVMVYAGGHISGGHYNPAVTIAVWLRGKCPVKDVIPYIIAQCLAAVAAGFLVHYLKGGMQTGGGLVPAMIPSFIVEFLFTFALCYVVLNTATADGTKGNSYYGLAIGFTVTVGALAVGSISGGAFNPAVALGLGVMSIVQWQFLWVHVLAQLAAAAAAAAVFKATQPKAA